MKIALVFLVLASVSRGEVVKSPSRGFEGSNSDKRGTQSLDKRTTVLGPATSSSTPRIEYAQTKELPRDQSPAQQIYVSSTPAPQIQIAKFSDVLAGQGPPFHHVIASHLYSPISVYQPRLSTPTIYEISQPIQSQLAYSENLPQQSTPPFGQRIQKPERVTIQTPPSQPQVQSAVQQYQQVKIVPQPIYQLPQAPPSPVRYQQNQIPLFPQVVFPQNNQNQLQQVYSQILPVPQNVQPGIIYVKEEKKQREEQRSLQELKEGRPALKNLPSPPSPQVQQQQIYQSQPQGAISYASFSQSQPAPSYQLQQQPHNQQLQAPQPQQLVNLQQYQNQLQQLHNQRQQLVNRQQELRNQQQHLINQQQNQQLQNQEQQIQNQNYENEQLQIQNQQFQRQQQEVNEQQQQTQNQFDLRNQQIYQVIPLSQIQILPPSAQIPAQYQEAQNQYQNLISHVQPLIYKLEPAQANSVAVPVKPSPAYVKSAPVQLQERSLESQVFQPQVFSAAVNEPALVQTTGYGASFPAVQYFGKYAQAIFGGYPQK